MLPYKDPTTQKQASGLTLTFVLGEGQDYVHVFFKTPQNRSRLTGEVYMMIKFNDMLLVESHEPPT